MSDGNTGKIIFLLPKSQLYPGKFERESNTGIINEHESNGEYITIDGVKTFYLDRGSGPTVFCIAYIFISFS